MRARVRRTGTTCAVVLFALITIAAPPAPASTEPGPIVVGIVLPEAGPAFAVIQDPVTSTAGFYRVGASVGTAVVAKILADRVIIVSGDQQTQLRLATPVSPPPPVRRRGAPWPAAVARAWRAASVRRAARQGRAQGHRTG
jgi:hypothetical protein